MPRDDLTVTERLALLEDERADDRVWTRLRCLELAKDVLSWRYVEYPGAGGWMGGKPNSEKLYPDDVIMAAKRFESYCEGAE